MGIYVEALILYVLLFFSGAIGSAAQAPDAFSSAAVIAKILSYNVPSIALIWYLLVKAKRTILPPGGEEWNLIPGRKDLISGLITLPCLLITGFIISFISSYIGGTDAPLQLNSPSGPSQWIILCISCISSAYLEESFFRFYLLSRREELKLGAAQALVFSVALFSICHIYEGPWGFLNSVISGTLLSFVFLRYNSLHGIAIAHSLYNIIACIIAAMIK